MLNACTIGKVSTYGSAKNAQWQGISDTDLITERIRKDYHHMKNLQFGKFVNSTTHNS